MAEIVSNTTWAILKDMVDRGANLHYTENSDIYKLRVVNGPLTYEFEIFKIGHSVANVPEPQNGNDRADFEANYKAAANPIEHTKVEASFSSDQELNVNIASQGTVPSTFTKMTSSGFSSGVRKGELNTFVLYPQIRDEYMEEGGDLVGTVTSSNIVGQIFKASYDTISGLELTLGTAATDTEIDYIQGYASSTELRAVWVRDGDNYVSLSTSQYSPNNSSSQSMRFGLDETGDEWVKTISSTDMDGMEFSLDFMQNVSFYGAKVSFFIGDGTNTKSRQLVSQNENEWQTFTFSERDLGEDGIGVTNIGAITEIGFRVDDRDGEGYGYVDNIKYHSGTTVVDVKLWDLGPSLPVSGTTALSDGTQHSDLSYSHDKSAISLRLMPGTRRYMVRDFFAGLHGSTAPTVGNYYAITLSHNQNDVKVYGDAGNNYYTSGFGFTTPDESTEITTMGSGYSCFFSLFHTQQVYFTEISFSTHGISGGREAMATVLTEAPGEQIQETILTSIPLTAGSGFVRDLSIRPAILDDKGKLEIYYGDDVSDDVEDISFSATYLYEPQEPNL